MQQEELNRLWSVEPHGHPNGGADVIDEAGEQVAVFESRVMAYEAASMHNADVLRRIRETRDAQKVAS